MEFLNLNEKTVGYLEDRIEGFKEKEEKFSLGIIDIDFYDLILEEFGEDGLKISMEEVGKAISNLTRPIDLVEAVNSHQYIIGIREFSQDSLRVLLDRLRMSIDQFSKDLGDKDLKFTISSGGTELVNGDEIYSIVSRTLDQLRKSQDFGGNRVSIK